VLVEAGVGVPVGPLVVAVAPAVTVVGYETLGHRHIADTLQQL